MGDAPIPAAAPAGAPVAPAAPADPVPSPASRPRRRDWSWIAPALLGLTAVALLLWIAACAALWFAQERLLFRPTPLPADAVLAREPQTLERWIDVPGGRLSVAELRLPEPRGVVLLLHGNAGNLSTWFANTDLYRRANLDLVVMDYRGFGKSPGRIESEAQLHADVRAVWDDLAARYPDKPKVLLGRSLGSGIAARLAAEVQPTFTILVSPYRSMAELARLHYPWVPTQVLRYPLRTDQALPAVTGPVLLIHGELDTLIPPAHSEVLLGRARYGRRVVIPEAAHNDLQRHPLYLQTIEQGLTDLR